MLPYIDQTFIENATHFPNLAERLRQGFSENRILTPMRHHHDFANPKESVDSTLLLMPSWEEGQDLGVKLVNIFPNNPQHGRPSIQGLYTYFDGATGGLKAILDAKPLTAKRTAATSVMAAKLLAAKSAKTLLILGTGTLCKEMIQAYDACFALEQIWIWGRNAQKASEIVHEFNGPTGAYPKTKANLEAVSDYRTLLSQTDIISSITMSENPLIFGDELKEGTHLDLVGSYRPNMREADDAVIKRSHIFVDSYAGAMKETGDIAIPLASGLIQKSDLLADLFQLCAGKSAGRKTESEITLFKSVGHALEDLVAARYYFEQYQQKNG